MYDPSWFWAYACQITADHLFFGCHIQIVIIILCFNECCFAKSKFLITNVFEASFVVSICYLDVLTAANVLSANLIFDYCFSDCTLLDLHFR